MRYPVKAVMMFWFLLPARRKIAVLRSGSLECPLASTFSDPSFFVPHDHSMPLSQAKVPCRPPLRR
jgi:hypothetical protein